MKDQKLTISNAEREKLKGTIASLLSEYLFGVQQMQTADLQTFVTFNILFDTTTDPLTFPAKASKPRSLVYDATVAMKNIIISWANAVQIFHTVLWTKGPSLKLPTV